MGVRGDRGRPVYEGPERRRAGRPWAGREQIAVPNPPREGERSAAMPPPPDAGRGHVASGSGSRATTTRRAAHVAAGLLGWTVFVGLWVWQLEVYVPDQWLAGIVMIVAVLGAFAVATPAWVAWNRNIYRRRHRRTKPLVMEVAFDEDALGRRIVADPGVRTAPGRIVVEVDETGRAKTYRVAARGREPEADDRARYRVAGDAGVVR